jgi:hypothetical protein
MELSGSSADAREDIGLDTRTAMTAATPSIEPGRQSPT